MFWNTELSCSPPLHSVWWCNAVVGGVSGCLAVVFAATEQWSGRRTTVRDQGVHNSTGRPSCTRNCYTNFIKQMLSLTTVTPHPHPHSHTLCECRSQPTCNCKIMYCNTVFCICCGTFMLNYIRLQCVTLNKKEIDGNQAVPSSSRVNDVQEKDPTLKSKEEWRIQSESLEPQYI